MLRTNLRGQVRQTVLPKWKPLLPLFEAVMNALQAVQDAPGRHHKVIIHIERDSELVDDGLAAINGFTVTDTGIGFNDVNFDSFNTAFSEYKFKRGGKGLGRFIWLKAFQRVEIDSFFAETDIDGLIARKFIFDGDYDPEKAPSAATDHGQIGTTVRLVGFREPYKSECPRLAEQIAQRLVEHFLLVFLQEECPVVEVHDYAEKISLNRIFETDFRATATASEFTIKDATFQLHGFRLTTPRVSKHRLIYAANHRGVVSDKLEDYLPNLNGRLVDEGGNSFVYLAVIQGDYLNQRVNNARTDFDIGGADDAEADAPTLFADEIRRADIRDACIERINDDLKDVIESINALKEERIFRYVQDDAPQYKVLLKYRDEFINKISPNASKADLEAALHREIYQREVKLKQEGARIIKEAEKLDDYESYHTRFSEFMDRYNELGVSALAQYVAHRKIILDFLDRSISLLPEKGQYPLERAVHNLIYPVRTTSEDVPYHQQNLWIIDERLTYHSFLASDKPLKSLESIESDSAKRPDLFIFDRKVAFTEGDQPITSMTVVEFKRPQRDDYKADDNPLKQSFDMVEEVRRGQFKDHRGRPISALSDKIPAYCYVICDLTPSLHEVLLDMEGADLTPDGQGYYGYHKRRRIFFEVIDYNKLLRDAKKRNRIFFDTLNIMGQR